MSVPVQKGLRKARPYGPKKDESKVCIVIKPSLRWYEVPKAELKRDIWGRNTEMQTLCNELPPNAPFIYLDDEHPAIFGFYALWLNGKPLLPFQDISIRLQGPEPENRSQKAPATFKSDITILKLGDGRFDQLPATMSTTRKLFHAYFFGQAIGAFHFQDAIMNNIVKYFRADFPPLPPLVFDIYARSRPGLLGLKKLLVDYYIWGCMRSDRNTPARLVAMNGLSAAKLPKLKDYPDAFIKDVMDTKKAMETVKSRVDGLTTMEDVEVDFMRPLQFLCDGACGTQKCRYHQHTSKELCFSLIVDDKPLSTLELMRPRRGGRGLMAPPPPLPDEAFKFD